jgi:putative ABC transport system substrate-binding protein
MRRREFLAGLGSVAAWPRRARAQDDRVRRIGILLNREAADEETQAMVRAFRSEMPKLGWSEGRNLRIDLRFGAGDPDRLHEYAAELVTAGPDVIVTSTAAATKAAQQLTHKIPIVITGAGDPVLNGIVKSLARPEGNTTGITNLFASMGSKWLQLLKQAAPKLDHVALIYNERLVTDERGSGYFQPAEEAARGLEMSVTRIGYRDAVDLVHAVEAFAAKPNGGLILLPPAPTPTYREAILRLAAQYRLPTMHASRQYVAEGGLMAYGSKSSDRWRRAASFVDRILRGAKVSDLPVEYPTTFELVINLKTAKAIGLTVPPTLQALADEFIE